MLRLRVLVVDADRESVEVYRTALYRHEVTIVASIAEARAALAGQQFEVVIADRALPDGDGTALLGEVGAAGPSITCILHVAPEQLVESQSFLAPKASECRGSVQSFLAPKASECRGSVQSSEVRFCVLPKPSWHELTELVAELAQPETDAIGPGAGETRVGPRRPIELAAFVRYDPWHRLRRLYTVDVSEHGLAVRSADPARPGTPIRIALDLPDGSRLHLDGEVRHSTPMPWGRAAPWKIGVQLTDPEASKQRILRELVSSQPG
jgi:CheY-like chemotaxis protein